MIDRHSDNEPRRGMTFLEILFVIIIIAVLVSLLLPAIQGARMRARQISCEKNLSQLILAIKQYQYTHEYYPPGVIEDAPGSVLSTATGKKFSWIAQILPQINENSLFRGIDFKASVYHPKHSPVRSAGISLLQCPSLGAPGGLIQISNYAAVHNDIELPIATTNNGMFFVNSRLGPRDVKDGLSHTVFIGESVPFPGGLGWMSGTRATLRNFGTPLSMTGRGSSNRYLVQSIQPGVPLPAKWIPAPSHVGGFGSAHVTVTGFAFGDGRVQYISDQVDMLVMQQLANRHDGMPLIDRVQDASK